MEYNTAEIVVDNFAGGGGASTGIERALGRSIDVAINHNEEAIAMHRINHPQTKHFCKSIFEVPPEEATKGRPVGLAWFSPDCKHFSKAKGSAPKSKQVRGLAWVVINWVNKVSPRVIMLENVEEFQGWGPLCASGVPHGHRKGWYFDCFVGALRRRGYKVEYKELRACDYGAPTIRKRFFLIARRDGEPLTWPKPTHAKPGSPEVQSGACKPWVTAAECIDFSLPCPSIFLTREECKEQKLNIRRPLADATLKRIAKGIDRYVLNTDTPFIVESPETPIAPFLTECANASSQRVVGADEPPRTQCAQAKGGHFALVSVFLAKQYSTGVGQSVEAPIGALTCAKHYSLVQALLVKYYGNEKDGVDITDPMHTVTSKGRFGLILVQGSKYQIEDIGMRMLQPTELYKGQGFPDDYVIEFGLFEVEGKLVRRKLTKTAQVRMCGNAVCPALSEALVSANLPDLVALRKTA